MNIDTYTEILLRVPINQLNRYCSSNKAYQQICSNDHFWQLRTGRDYPNRGNKPEDLTWLEWYQQLSVFLIDLNKFNDDIEESESYYIYEIVPRVLKRIETLVNNSDEDKFHYSDDFNRFYNDFNKTNGYVGIITKSRAIAGTLLFIIKVLLAGDLSFDHHFYDLEWANDFDLIAKSITIDDYILSGRSFVHYLASSDIKVEIEFNVYPVIVDETLNQTKIGKAEKVIKPLDQFDIWTLERVKNYYNAHYAK